MKQQAVASNLQNYVHQAWLVGLGAYGKIQKEGGRFFDTLVKEGKAFERSHEEAAGAQAQASKVHKPKLSFQNSMAKYANKVGKMVQGGVNDALHWLNIATDRDIKTLSRHLDELEASIRELKAIRKSNPAIAEH